MVEFAFVSAYAPSSQALIEGAEGGQMGAWDTVRAELEEQRCLIEQQQITIQRQQRKIELQLQLTAHMQAELERMQLALHRAAPVLYPTQASSSDGNGNGHHVETGRHKASVSDSISQ